MDFKMQRPKGLEDWVSSVSPETVALAQKVFEEGEEDFPSKGNTNFVGVSVTGDFDWVKGTACHAYMSSLAYRDVIVTENTTKRAGKGLELCRPFLRWFLYDSPYGFIILNRDDLDWCENHGFVIAGDAPTTLVQCALIISRHFKECTNLAFETFNKLLARGIDGFIAYQICFNSNISGLSSYKGRHFEYLSGHRVSGAVSPSVALDYYEGEVQGDISRTYKDAPSIYGSSSLFVSSYTYNGSYALSNWRRNNKDFHNFLLEKEGKLNPSEAYRPPNPFAPKPADYNEHKFTCEQAVTDVADYYQQYVKENL